MLTNRNVIVNDIVLSLIMNIIIIHRISIYDRYRTVGTYGACMGSSRVRIFCGCHVFTEEPGLLTMQQTHAGLQLGLQSLSPDTSTK